MNAALIFEPDGYVLDGPKLMGRQSAGNGFLRAAVAAHGVEPIFGVSPYPASAQAFEQVVRSISPQAEPRWIPLQRLDRIAERGVLYRPDLNMAALARTRLRAGPAAFSLCGVTHTLSSHGAAESVAALLSAPVMPWDAVVCTSRAAVGFVETTLAAEREYLAWRFPGAAAPPSVQMPVIPLGVHPGDFEFSEADRQAARKGLGLAPEEVAALFAGRLTFNGKAHPFQMYRAADAAARRSSRPLVLVIAGQAPSAAIEQAFRSAAARFCPSARVLFVDGKDAEVYRGAWRASDIFVSLSDSIQETFGITPLEAMAAGLPVLVSDWNGYRETVRDGVDGFRIPTWAPAPGAAGQIAWEYDATLDYEAYLSRASTTVSVDPAVAAERLAQLVGDPELRRTMGAAGREHVRRNFDWAVVYRQYQALWAELDAIRTRMAGDPVLRAAAAPRVSSQRLDPSLSFRHYPTLRIGPATRIAARPGASAQAYEALTSHITLSFWKSPAELVGRLFAATAAAPMRLDALAAALGVSVAGAAEMVGRLAKLELVSLHPPEEAS